MEFDSYIGDNDKQGEGSASSFSQISSASNPSKLNITDQSINPLIASPEQKKNFHRRSSNLVTIKNAIGSPMVLKDIDSKSDNQGSRSHHKHASTLQQKLKYKMNDVYFPMMSTQKKATRKTLQQEMKMVKKYTTRILNNEGSIEEDDAEDCSSKRSGSGKKSRSSYSNMSEERSKPIPRLTGSLILDNEPADVPSRALVSKDFHFPDENVNDLINEEKTMLRRELFHIEKEEHGPLRDFISQFIIISTMNPVFQSWKLFVLVLSFLSSFYYAYGVSISERLPNYDELLDDFEKGHTVFEILFLIDTIINFFVEYRYEASDQVERDIVKLAVLYIKGDFFIDAITLFPFPSLLKNLKHAQLAYLIKLLRLYNGFNLLNYKVMIREIKLQQQQRLQKLIQTKPKLASSQEHDQTNITMLIIIKYILQIIQLVSILVCLSILTGLLWWKFCDLEESEFNLTSFITRNNLDVMNFASDRIISMSYFMFTTLSTVGLGDYHPTNDPERVFGTLIMLFGVLITSFVNENLMRMMRQFQWVDSGFDEEDQLFLFLTVMKKFNNNQDLPEELSSSIEQYFKYRWANDHTQAIKSREDFDLLEQLPKSVQHSIYIDFLFKDFLSKYSMSLNFEVMPIHSDLQALQSKLGIQIDQSVFGAYIERVPAYSKKNDFFKSIIVLLLQNLEPRVIQEGEIIILPNSEVDEVVFFLNGQIKVGYSILAHKEQEQKYREQLLKRNRKGKKRGWKLHKKITDVKEECSACYSYSEFRMKDYKFPIQLEAGQIAIGMYELVFKRLPKYVYRAHIPSLKQSQTNEAQQGVMNGYFIRRHRVQEIMKAISDLGSLQRHFKMKILTNFLNRIHIPIQKDQALVSAHRELYEQKLNVFFKDKVNHLFKQHLGLDKLGSDANAFLEKLQTSKALNPKKIRELFFVEMQKYPALEEKMGSLRFPKMATMLEQTNEDQLEQPPVRTSSEIMRQQFLDSLKDPAIQALLQELNIQAFQIKKLDKNNNPISLSLQEETTLSQGSSMSSSSRSGTNRHPVSIASPQGFPGETLSDQQQPKMAVFKISDKKEQMFEVYHQQLNEQAFYIRRMIQKFEGLQRRLVHQQEITESLTQEIKFKDKHIKSQSDLIRKLRTELDNRSPDDNKSVHSLYSSQLSRKKSQLDSDNPAKQIFAHIVHEFQSNLPSTPGLGPKHFSEHESEVVDLNEVELQLAAAQIPNMSKEFSFAAPVLLSKQSTLDKKSQGNITMKSQDRSKPMSTFSNLAKVQENDITDEDDDEGPQQRRGSVNVINRKKLLSTFEVNATKSRLEAVLNRIQSENDPFANSPHAHQQSLGLVGGSSDEPRKFISFAADEAHIANLNELLVTNETRKSSFNSSSPVEPGSTLSVQRTTRPFQIGNRLVRQKVPLANKANSPNTLGKIYDSLSQAETDKLFVQAQIKNELLMAVGVDAILEEEEKSTSPRKIERGIGKGLIDKEDGGRKDQVGRIPSPLKKEMPLEISKQPEPEEESAKDKEEEKAEVAIEDQEEGTAPDKLDDLGEKLNRADEEGTAEEEEKVETPKPPNFNSQSSQLSSHSSAVKSTKSPQNLMKQKTMANHALKRQDTFKGQEWQQLEQDSIMEDIENESEPSELPQSDQGIREEIQISHDFIVAEEEVQITEDIPDGASESSHPQSSRLLHQSSSIKESILVGDEVSSKCDPAGSIAKGSGGVDSIKESIRVGSVFEKSLNEPTIPDSIASAYGSVDELQEADDKNEKAEKSRFSKQQQADKISESIISQASESSGNLSIKEYA